ncbi:hypothetical protein ABGB12_14255 [Actinocorallia sp. B10E7]|uniref:hypothetical protein n=1 Tax=Actinocorallia sp. B10E7 TaxID=3153558 RepID=UPI00325ED351
MARKLVFARSARKHRIGKAHALHVMRSGPPVVVPPTGGELDDRWVWVGADERGVELEVIALLLPQMLLVIHVMPTALRRR